MEGNSVIEVRHNGSRNGWHMNKLVLQKLGAAQSGYVRMVQQTIVYMHNE